MISTTLKYSWILLLAAICLGSIPSPTLAGEGDPMTSGVIEHLIQEGDNLHLLSGYYFKDPRMWQKIFSLNRATITDPNLLYPGYTLKIKADPARQWDIPYADFVARVRR